MTAKTVHVDEKGQGHKMPGWFSWRHKTREAHDAAVARYRDRASGRPKQTWDETTRTWIKDGAR